MELLQYQRIIAGVFIILVRFLISRKSFRVATEDKYGSNVNMEPDSPTDEDKKAKQDEGKNKLQPEFINPCSNSSTLYFPVPAKLYVCGDSPIKMI